MGLQAIFKLSMRTELLLSLQSCRSIHADASCKGDLKQKSFTSQLVSAFR